MAVRPLTAVAGAVVAGALGLGALSLAAGALTSGATNDRHGHCHHHQEEPTQAPTADPRP